MTDQTPSTSDAPASPKPYHMPTLTELGSVEAVTAGPNSGSIDQLVGASGGFQDGTS